MTDKQRQRINVLLLAGADITRHPQRRIDSELYDLLTRGRPLATEAQTAGRPKRSAPEQVQYAALYF